MRIVWRSVEEKCGSLGFSPKDSVEWEKICLFGQGRREAPHGRVLYAAVRALRPRRILDVGTGRGFSALVMALAQRDAGVVNGEILTIDLIPQDEPQFWHTPNRHVRDDPAASGPISRRELLKDFRSLVDGRVLFETGTSHEKLASLPDSSMDFAFIDGDHRRKGVSGDWEQVRRALAPWGAVAFDDYDLGVDLGETLCSRVSRHIGSVQGMWRICRLFPSLRFLTRDQSKSVRRVIFSGVRQVVDGIYGEGSWNLEAIPYSGTLGVAILTPAMANHPQAG